MLDPEKTESLDRLRARRFRLLLWHWWRGPYALQRFIKRHGRRFLLFFRILHEPLLKIEPYTDAAPKDFEALGRFISRYSYLEISLHFALKSLLGLDEEIERMLVREARLTDLFEFMKKAAAHHKVDELGQETIKGAITTIQYLNRIRAVVAHKPFVMGSDGSMIFHDLVTAPSLDETFGYQCSAKQLDDAGYLAFKVALILLEFRDRPSAESHTDLNELHALTRKLQLPVDPAHMKQKTAKSRAQRQSSPA